MRLHKLCRLLALGSVFTVTMMGCSTSKDARSEGRALDDKNITSDVKKRLKEEPVYKFSDVSVNTFAGIVELSGFVDTEAQRKRAEAIAQNTNGARGVVNGLALKPVALEPTGRTNAASTIYAEPQHPVNPSAPAQPGQ